MSLRKVDLNLLVIFDALISERSVRKASLRIGLSQSATSHALGRLRAILQDELFVRTITGMEPTPRALELAGPLRLALQDIEATLTPDRFDPLTATQEFTVAVETYETLGVLTPLVDRVRKEAPGIDMIIRSGSEDSIYNEIDSGRADLAFGAFRALPERYMTRSLLSDRFVCIMRPDHPLASAPLTLDGFISAAHIFISMSGTTSDVVDEALADLGLHRRIAFRVPNAFSALLALARSDMIAVISKGAADLFETVGDFVVCEPPLDIPPVDFRLIWSRRMHESLAHQWLRSLLASIGSDVMARQKNNP